MEEELDKTVSVYSKRVKNNYKLLICRKKGHNVIDLNDFKKNEITFGRSKTNDICIDENIVSGHHGKFILEDGLKIVDNNSTNGLIINGEQKSEAMLSNGDAIKIDNPDVTLEQAVMIFVILGDIPNKCPNCDEKIIKEEKEETKESKKEKKKCKYCGELLDEDVRYCTKCGEDLERLVNTPQRNKSSKKGLIIGIVSSVLVIVIGIIVLIIALKGKDDYDNLPVKVDYSMTSYYGSISEILDELGLDFDLVTAGSNCYTGTYSATFETKKYGILHTEFRYCAANKTTMFRVYNSEQDQKLRNPKAGELPQFDSYGEKIGNNI